MFEKKPVSTKDVRQIFFFGHHDNNIRALNEEPIEIFHETKINLPKRINFNVHILNIIDTMMHLIRLYLEFYS